MKAWCCVCFGVYLLSSVKRPLKIKSQRSKISAEQSH